MCSTAAANSSVNPDAGAQPTDPNLSLCQQTSLRYCSLRCWMRITICTASGAFYSLLCALAIVRRPLLAAVPTPLLKRFKTNLVTKQKNLRNAECAGDQRALGWQGVPPVTFGRAGSVLPSICIHRDPMMRCRACETSCNTCCCGEGLCMHSTLSTLPPSVIQIEAFAGIAESRVHSMRCWSTTS